MHQQRGIISTELIVGAVSLLAIVGILAGAVLYTQHVRSSAHAEGVSEGRKAALLAVAHRDNEQLVAAEAEIARLTKAKDALERTAAARVAQIDKEGRDALKALEGQHGRFLDDLFAGRVQLPDAGRADASCPGGRDDRPAAVAGAASVGDGAAGAELPAEAGRFFGTEAKRADAVTVQLTACQAIVRADRAPAGAIPRPGS